MVDRVRRLSFDDDVVLVVVFVFEDRCVCVITIDQTER